VCGSICDDIELTVHNNVITEVKNACAIGAAKFLTYNDHRPQNPQIRKNGKLVDVPLNEAIRKSAEILLDANYPILYGWSCTSCEAIRAGLKLAEDIGGVIDNTTTVCHGPSILAIQDVGLSGSTLGQLRHRADLVIYWGCNPWSAHPRHIERYSAFSDGRFQESTYRRYFKRLSANSISKKVQRATNRALNRSITSPPSIDRRIPYTLSREERKLVVIDVRKTRTAEIADYFLQVEPNSDYELLQAFRALIWNEVLEVDEVGGIPVEVLEEVADIMVGCRLGIIFFGLGLTMSTGKHRNIDSAISLTRDLNRYTKFLIMPMRGHFNVAGANTVFTWQSGYPFAVDYTRGYPRYNPGETSIIEILCRRESDAGLVIASDPVANFPKKAVTHLVNNPLIVIDPHISPTSLMADVVIPSTFVGIETEGIAYRMDHIPLPMKKIVDGPKGILSDTEILTQITREVHKLRER
jgi:formylmethanofuran dehydrogenase subunit B